MKEYVYVISSPLELIKLGVARKPKQRLSAVRRPVLGFHDRAGASPALAVADEPKCDNRATRSDGALKA